MAFLKALSVVPPLSSYGSALLPSFILSPAAGRCQWADAPNFAGKFRQSVQKQEHFECAPRLPGCGTQHPHRALGGTRILLAAAPTTPPCFRHWRRSSLLHSSHIQRKNVFYFVSVAVCGPRQTHFHRRGRSGKRHFLSSEKFRTKSSPFRGSWQCRKALPERVLLFNNSGTPAGRQG